MAAAWQVWDSAQEGAGDTIHIDYDGEYGSERVLIVSGRAARRGEPGTIPRLLASARTDLY